MLKKIVVGIGIVLFTSTLAPAQTAPTDASSASLLGLVEGAINFCSKVSPGSPSEYKQIDQIFLQGQSEKSIEQVRQGSAYTTSFDQTKKLLQGLSSADASAVCKAH